MPFGYLVRHHMLLKCLEQIFECIIFTQVMLKDYVCGKLFMS